MTRKEAEELVYKISAKYRATSLMQACDFYKVEWIWLMYEDVPYTILNLSDESLQFWTNEILKRNTKLYKALK